MAETQDSLNPFANGVPAKVDGELESRKSAEQQYIKFLEEKISHLLRDTKVGSVSEVPVS